jgi:hypothetical protein
VRKFLTFEQKSAAMREKNAAGLPTLGDPIAERRYSSGEVAAKLNLSVDMARRIFADEPGVLVIGDQSTKHKRRYRLRRMNEIPSCVQDDAL